MTFKSFLALWCFSQRTALMEAIHNYSLNLYNRIWGMHCPRIDQTSYLQELSFSATEITKPCDSQRLLSAPSCQVRGKSGRRAGRFRQHPWKDIFPPESGVLPRVQVPKPRLVSVHKVDRTLAPAYFEPMRKTFVFIFISFSHIFYIVGMNKHQDVGWLPWPSAHPGLLLHLLQIPDVTAKRYEAFCSPSDYACCACTCEEKGIIALVEITSSFLFFY